MPVGRRTARVLATLLFWSLAAEAAVVPVGFFETTLTNQIIGATAMAVLPDGRILVTQQTGALRVVKNDALLAGAAATLTVDSTGERGLLGVAVDPSFATNGFIYLYYTVPAGATAVHNRLSRFTMVNDSAGSELVLLNLDSLSTATNHNGGALHFGGDGKLYIGVGENANSANAQTLGNLLGKLLRLNADGTIPSDNPFFASATGNNRAIWALGLRNPFTFAFLRTGGRLFINDVGLSTFEELNDGVAGANYGWPNSEGPTTTAGVTGPLYWYGHGTGPFLGCAVTGGTFYDPPTVNFPSPYVGKFFFADLCGGWINLLDPAAPQTAQTFVSGVSQPVDLQVDGSGRLLYLQRGSGSLTRLAAHSPAALNTVTPCRAIDTRSGDGGALAANSTRVFPLGGRCAVPTDALSAAVNLTVINPGQGGFVAAYPGNFTTVPGTSSVSFKAGRTVANNLTLALATDGTGTIRVHNASGAAIHLALDVNGYFR